jgi:ABC-type nitrate/sulfonate/bicarbonate transport system substrate-binding protein
MKLNTLLIGGVAALALASTPAFAQSTLTVNGFGNATDLPVWIAQQKGFFAKQGLTVEYQQTRGSVAQFQDIMAGKFEIMATLLDNVVGYAEQQGEVKLDPPSDVFVFMGSHAGVNSLVTPANIHGYADMKGGAVAVDALSTGYAFIVYSILEKNGLILGHDYKAIAVGGPQGRLDALKDGRAQAGLIATPMDLTVKAQGLSVLTDTVKALGPYQAGVYTARRSWAGTHRQELVGFTTAMIAAHRYIFDDKAGAIDVLRNHFPTLSAQDAESVYTTMTTQGGFDRDGKIDPAGAKTVLELRSRYSPAKVTLTDPGKYIDLSYYEQASARQAVPR